MDCVRVCVCLVCSSRFYFTCGHSSRTDTVVSVWKRCHHLLVCARMTLRTHTHALPLTCIQATFCQPIWRSSYRYWFYAGNRRSQLDICRNVNWMHTCRSINSNLLAARIIDLNILIRSAVVVIQLCLWKHMAHFTEARPYRQINGAQPMRTWIH